MDKWFGRILKETHSDIYHKFWLQLLFGHYIPAFHFLPFTVALCSGINTQRQSILNYLKGCRLVGGIFQARYFISSYISHVRYKPSQLFTLQLKKNDLSVDEPPHQWITDYQQKSNCSIAWSIRTGHCIPLKFQQTPLLRSKITAEMHVSCYRDT